MNALKQQINLLIGVVQEAPKQRLTDEMRARQREVLRHLKDGRKTTKRMARYLDLTYDATRWTLQRMPEVARFGRLWGLK